MLEEVLLRRLQRLNFMLLIYTIGNALRQFLIYLHKTVIHIVLHSLQLIITCLASCFFILPFINKNLHLNKIVLVPKGSLCGIRKLQ